MKSLGIRYMKLAMVAFICLCFLTPCAVFADDKSVKLPATMLWGVYEVGSTGYNHASAMADALQKKYQCKIRLMPSGTSIGRIMPLAAKKVSVGWLATEAYFAAEGLYDFASPEWGPQDLRTVLAHPTAHAVIVTREGGIKTLKDLKGKRVSWIPGTPSLNVKMEAYLAFAGLTWDDVKRVEFPSYAATMRGLIEGSVDAVVGTATAGLAYELESTPNGVYYPPFPPSDKEGWARMLKIAPFLKPYKETVGAGISAKNPVDLVQYCYPIGTVYADASADYVYNLVKALDETYPMYEKSNPNMDWWKIERGGIPPVDSPFHEGAIKYFKEKGIWKPEHQAWNDRTLAHLKKIQKAWKDFIPVAKKQDLKGEKFEEAWLKARAKAMAD